MIRNFLLSICSLLLFVGSTIAQQRTCGANEVLARQLLEDPDMQQRMKDIERHTEDFIQSGGAHDRVQVTIPVVVHVVYYNSTQNISDAQILSQIDVLNADFRRLNADAANTPSVWQSIAADCEINFCMAAQDPSGNATTGIERRQTTVNGFSTNDNVKFYSSGGLNAWDRNKYLNLWVCNLSGGLLGYAQFPGGGASTDGVVCDYAYFGTVGVATPPFHLGRTATHEVGHWLNCYHIWGDDGTSCNGSDGVSDTPNQADENYGCPSFPTISCSNGPNGDMFMNYMDYTDDACMNVFTNGQKSRMQSLFNAGGARAALLTSNGCDQPGGGGSCGTPGSLSATNITQTSATLGWGAVSGATSYNLQYKLSVAGSWTTVSVGGTSYNLSGLTAGSTYNYQVQAVCGATTGSYSSASSFTTQSGGGGSCSDAYEPNNSRNAAKVIPTDVAFQAQIATASDNDWYRFSNTSSKRRIKIDMTTLPDDYDVRLYRNNSYLAVSQNAGTLDEQIIYNTNTVSSSYYAYVYGYNGANSNTQCYTLKVSLSSTNWRLDGSTEGEVEEVDVPLVFENAGFGMYPNPATGEVTVEIPVEADSDVTLTVMDPSGKAAIQLHSAINKGNNRLNFDVSDLPNGVYFVQLRNGSLAHTRKLVVNK
ncbi:MAG: T9SS type A sorting domain-containing protein [Saprospiraceae bacterium]|nr:T9SS type A sorting domain-containing protein [Saprospiraceae bacterium]